MEETIPTTDTSSENLNSKKRNITPIIVGFLLVLILVFASGIYIIDKSQNTEDNSELVRDIQDVEQLNIESERDAIAIERMINYGNYVVKEEYRVDRLGQLQKNSFPDMNTVEYGVNQFLSENVNSLAYAESSAGEPLGLRLAVQYSDIVVNNSLASISALFDEYFVMPQSSDEDWKIEEYRGATRYELIIDNSDGSIDTRSASVAPNGELFNVIIAACRVEKTNPRFSKRTCFESGNNE